MCEEGHKAVSAERFGQCTEMFEQPKGSSFNLVDAEDGL